MVRRSIAAEFKQAVHGIQQTTKQLQIPIPRQTACEDEEQGHWIVESQWNNIEITLDNTIEQKKATKQNNIKRQQYKQIGNSFDKESTPKGKRVVGENAVKKNHLPASTPASFS